MRTWELAEYGLVGEFEGTEKMICNNPGYDLLLSDGSTVDVKSALCQCVSMKNDYISWVFQPKWKKFPDYFMLVAFDDDYSRKPKHLWMVPADIIWKESHGKKRIVINNTLDDLSKWRDYERDASGLIDRCEHIKNQKQGCVN